MPEPQATPLGAPGPTWAGSGRPAFGRTGEAPRGPAEPARPVEAEAFAGFGRRAAGAIIDTLIVSTVLAMLFLVLGADPGAATAGDSDADELLDRLSLVGLLLRVGYAWLWNSLGQSPGKRVVGIRIITDGGRPPGVGRGFARTAGALLSELVLFAGYLWAIRDRQRQTWHDKIASTYVVIDRRER